MSAGCGQVRPLVASYVDGELSCAQVVEVERHVESCEHCAERVALDQALRVGVRRSVTRAAEVSPGFERRLRLALAADRERESQKAERRGVQPLGWRFVLPLAAAAAVAVGLGWAREREPAQELRAAPVQAAMSTPDLSTDDLVDRIESQLDKLVDNHVRARAHDSLQPSLVGDLEPEVGVPVRLPSLQQYGGELRGVSVVRLTERRAAQLRYDLWGHRVTMYIYDARRVPLRSALEARVVQNAPVYVGTRRGYSIAAVERQGVGYALTTDLNDRESAELIVRSVH